MITDIRRDSASCCHTAVLVLDLRNWSRFHSFFHDAENGVTILDARQDGEDRIVVRAQCSSQAVLDRLTDAWA